MTDSAKENARTTHDLEAEADALVSAFNAGKADYSPSIEWFGMSVDRESEEEQFVLEAEEYIDNGGIEALRGLGRQIRYIEAYEYDGVITVQLEIPVEGEVPTND